MLMKESITIRFVASLELYEKQSVFKTSRIHSRSITLLRQIITLPTINIAKSGKSKSALSISLLTILLCKTPLLRRVLHLINIYTYKFIPASFLYAIIVIVE